MYVICKSLNANLKLIDSPDISTVPVASYADFTAKSVSFWSETDIDCVAVSD